MKKTLAALGFVLALTGARWFFLRPRPSILLITVDTLRPDRLGAYGSRSVKTPNLDRLARDGITFMHALTTVPLTLPSHASIMTGQYPPAHAVRDNGDFVLPPGVPTLAERLKSRGYETGAFVGSYVLASRFGLNRGFDVYDDAFGAAQGAMAQGEAPERRADQVIAAAMRWLEQRNAPFFCWIHLNDPHTPYDPPEPYRSQYRGRLYDGEVAFTDAALQPLLELLVRKNWYDHMVVVATGDHGESLGEHGESTHGYFVYQSTMHVPLLLKAPGARMAGSRIDENVSLIDLAPTLLSLSGAGTAKLPGVDLMRRRGAVAGPRQLYSESYYGRFNFGWSELRSLSSGTWKYIAAPIPELYRLDQDPAETHNVAPERRDLIAGMHARLVALESENVSPVEPSKSRLDPSARAKLRSLGYLAGIPQRASGAAYPLPDPKDKLGVYQAMVGAQELVAAGQHAAAARQFEAALRSDPNMTLAHHQLGGCYLVLGRPPDAMREFERALVLNPQFIAARFDLGVARIQAGHYQEAVNDFEQILRESPNDYETLNYLGMALSGAGNDAQAMDALRRSIATQPSFGEAYFNLARLQIRAGDHAGALESFTKAELSGFSSARLHADFGWLRMQRNEVDAAIAEYTQALEIDPNDPIVHNNLGFAFAAKGNLDLAVQHYRSALQLQPSYDRARANLVAALAKAGSGSSKRRPQ